jgi:hypothetical protein
LAKLLEQFRPFFERHKTFTYLAKYILSLLSDVKRKSIEPIALAAGWRFALCRSSWRSFAGRRIVPASR